MNSTGAIEAYGRAFQTLYIECTDANGQHCGMDLSLTADFFHIPNSERLLLEAWNKLGLKDL